MFVCSLSRIVWSRNDFIPGKFSGRAIRLYPWSRLEILKVERKKERKKKKKRGFPVEYQSLWNYLCREFIRCRSVYMQREIPRGNLTRKVKESRVSSFPHVSINSSKKKSIRKIRYPVIFRSNAIRDVYMIFFSHHFNWFNFNGTLWKNRVHMEE